jgi:hypothetical protein
MVETQKSNVSNQPRKTSPLTTNAGERHAERRAHTSITRIKTVDSNQVIVQTHLNGYPEKVLCTQYPSTRCSTHFFFPARLENPYEGIIVFQW